MAGVQLLEGRRFAIDPGEHQLLVAGPTGVVQGRLGIVHPAQGKRWRGWRKAGRPRQAGLQAGHGRWNAPTACTGLAMDRPKPRSGVYPAAMTGGKASVYSLKLATVPVTARPDGIALADALSESLPPG